MNDGTIPRLPTSPHPPLPNAPGWFARAAQQPATSVSLAGVIALGIVQGYGAISGGATEQDLLDRIAKIEKDKADQARADKIAEDAQACAEGMAALLDADPTKSPIAKVRKEHRDHADEQLEFQAEIASYAETAFAAFAKKLKVPADDVTPSPRFDEYKKKGFARGIQGDR